MKPEFYFFNFTDSQVQGFLAHAAENEMPLVGVRVFRNLNEMIANEPSDRAQAAAFVNLMDSNSPSLTEVCESLDDRALPIFVFLRAQAPVEAKIDSRLRFYEVSPESLEKTFFETIFEIFPASLKKICLGASRYIGNYVFPYLEVEFSESRTIKRDENLLVQSDLIGRSVCLTVSVKTNLNSFRSRNAVYSDIDDEMLVDLFSEFINQLIGSINYNLLKQSDLELRGSVPLSFLYGKGDAKAREQIFRPGFVISDPFGDIQVKFELLSGVRLPIEQLRPDQIEFSSTSRRVEFFD